MLTRQEIKKAVPHGYAKAIAVKAGVTQKTVSEYLNGKTNSKKVAEATIEVLKDIKASKEDFNNRLLAAIA